MINFRTLIENVNNKQVFNYAGRSYCIEEIAIPMYGENPIIAPDNISKNEIIDFERMDEKHYLASQTYYFMQRRYFVEIELGRELTEDEANKDFIKNKIREKFTWCYMRRFPEKVSLSQKA